MNKYLQMAVDGVELLLEKQSARVGGKPDGDRVIAVTRVHWDRFRTVGAQRGDTLLSYDIQGNPMDVNPTTMDFGVWKSLKKLGKLTGDEKYGQMVRLAARVFTEHGYEPISGLGYLGEEGNFDVVSLGLVPVYMSGSQFKPLRETPLEDLWEAGPEKTARMIRSSWLGLVTQPETMSYNRHCFYGFDDSEGKLANEFNSHHAAFAFSGAVMAQWWLFLYGKTGEAVWLERAQAMADKWQKVQHPETGLMPGWFGSDRNDEAVQPARDTCNNWDTMTAIGFLEAGEMAAKVPGGAPLAKQFREMGLKKMRGMVRYGYFEETGEMPQWLNLDGTLRTKRSWYTFHTEEEKAEWVAKDPIYKDTIVFRSYGYYRGLPWVCNAGMTAYATNIPYHTALAAAMTGDAYLIERGRVMAREVMKAARGLKSVKSETGQWTMPANALYVRMMLRMAEATGEKAYVELGQEIAEIEIGLQAKEPWDWWQIFTRNLWLEAMLDLGEAKKRL